MHIKLIYKKIQPKTAERTLMMFEKMTGSEYNDMVRHVRKLDRTRNGQSRINMTYLNQPFPSEDELRSLLSQLAGTDKKEAESALRMLIGLAEIYVPVPGTKSETRQEQFRNTLRKILIKNG